MGVGCCGCADRKGPKEIDENNEKSKEALKDLLAAANKKSNLLPMYFSIEIKFYYKDKKIYHRQICLKMRLILD